MSLQINCKVLENPEDCRVWHKEQKCPKDCPYTIKPTVTKEELYKLTKKEKRAFQRMVTGLSIGKEKNSYMRFITLTSAPDSPKDINYSFKMLKNRIARATPEQIKRINEKYKIDLPTFHGFKFNKYFKLKTAEGHNVLHIVYWGLKHHFIPQAWLKWNWDQIHGAFKADIRVVWRRHHTKNTRIQGLVGYMITNYLCKQPILRMSYGWKWAWLGFCKSWEHVKKAGRFVRKTARSADKPFEVQCNIPNSIRTFTARFVMFKYKYRNCTLEYWGFLMKEPLPTSRQLKMVNPDFSRFNSRWSWTP